MNKEKLRLMLKLITILLLIIIIILFLIKIYKVKNIDIYDPIVNYKGDNRILKEHKVNKLIIREVSFMYDPNKTTSSFNLQFYNKYEELYHIQNVKVIVKDLNTKKERKIDLNLNVDLAKHDYINYSFDIEDKKNPITDYKLEFILE